MITARNVVKSFDGVEMLHDFSSDFHEGEVSMVIGRSGSGKTVLMKSIIGLHPIDSGRIEYDGRNLPDMQTRDIRLLRREVGMLFQGAALFDSLSVINNVLFPLEMFSDMTRSEMNDRADFCLRRVNIEPHAYDLMPASISGGMQKRVAIARAIALNPRYLFCDEPNSGLDPQTSLVIDRLIHDITHEFNITTIVNSHDMNSIMEIGDHIVFINEGYKSWEGSRHDISHADNAALTDFVFASNLYKKVRETMQQTQPQTRK